jgi:hypothetical protein
MLCVHCSTPLTRDDWFCPYCKRSAPSRPRRARRPASAARPRAGLLLAWLLAGALAGGLAAARGLAGYPPPSGAPGAPAAETPEVVPVSLSGSYR